MKRFGTREVVSKGPYKCRFCAAILRDKLALEAQAWDWVTGNLPATEHCCPKCLESNSAMWREIVRRASQDNERSGND